MFFFFECTYNTCTCVNVSSKIVLWVCLSLLIVMLSARNACGHSPGPVLLVVSLHILSLTKASAMAGPALVVLITIARCTSII